MRTSNILKALAYILMPILLIVIIVNMICLFVIADNRQMFEKESYIETSAFGDTFYAEVNELKYYINNMVSLEDDYGLISIFNDKFARSINYNFLLIRTNDNATFSNITTGLEDIEAIKSNFKKQPYYFFCTDKIDTNINNQELKEKTYINTYRDKNFEIYIAFNSELDIDSGVYFEKVAFDYIKKCGKSMVYSIPICIVLEIILIIYLLWAIGHKKGEEKIYQTRFDKWPIEIITVIAILPELLLLWFFGAGFSFAGFWYSPENIDISIVLLSISIIICGIMYTILAITATSFVKKLKTRTLIKSSLTYIVCSKIIKWIKNIFRVISGNLNINLKFLGALLVLVIATVILYALFEGFGIFLSVLMYGVAIYFVMKRLYEFNKIKQHLKQLYSGNTTVNINISEYKGELKEIAIYINEISNGLESAVNEKLKSERLKTELITNVSHDIKTPLTSIINYVDLLKKEEITDVKIKEYIDILDNKSQRLKKLIEDLVEASKVSSGNITLEKQKINLVELINQTIGEFSDKFNQKNLNVLVNTNKKDEYNIEADTRYMYRIIENIFSNVYKYALENSRVYIDIKEENKKIRLEIKNISKEPLNITEEELIERFVRGDKSRNTEGNGLGLSIAKSLTELQNGEFRIVIDGDLFKVEIMFF